MFMPAVDRDTLERLISKGVNGKPWSNRGLAKAAAVEPGTIRNVRRDGRASMDTIERLANAFGCTPDCLMDNGQQVANRRKIVFDSLKEEYKTVLRSVLHSEEFATFAENNGGMFDADFLAYVYQDRKPYLNALDLSPDGREEVHDELCRDGLLWKKPLQRSDGSDFIQYCCRLWSSEQCEDNMELRIGIEKLAIERVIRLLTRNRAKYDAIRADIKRHLLAFEQLLPNLRKGEDEQIAFLGLKIDSKIHKAWAGDAPDYRAAMSRAVFGHGQLIHGYISQIQIARQQPDSPPDMPTLFSLALSSYSDLHDIFEAFIKIESPDDKELIDALLKLVDQHPRNNWNRIVEVERFNKRRN
jgi:transcriptional regulator with XRE-family HTH domain